ncbi:MAG: dTDP-4-dehydrorhamnose 3,5-epimerase [Anaerolineales bacterium]|nr:dTDP-4-dehydrorhamnose 3,5-epimerase [Anaerolineales bacterium]
MPFQFQQLQIPDVILVKPQVFGDKRGFFKEVFQQSEFAQNGIFLPFVQDNYSFSAYGVLRGLHYQKPPFAQGKLLMAVRGEIFDVAVDIRRGSPTYGQWVGEVLSENNHQMLYVPPGFAHGFCVLSKEAALSYKVTAPYAADYEKGILWNDPSIGIEWPIDSPILSDRDVALPLMEDADNPFTL